MIKKRNTGAINCSITRKELTKCGEEGRGEKKSRLRLSSTNIAFLECKGSEKNVCSEVKTQTTPPFEFGIEIIARFQNEGHITSTVGQL